MNDTPHNGLGFFLQSAPSSVQARRRSSEPQVVTAQLVDGPADPLYACPRGIVVAPSDVAVDHLGQLVTEIIGQLVANGQVAGIYLA